MLRAEGIAVMDLAKPGNVIAGPDGEARLVDLNDLLLCQPAHEPYASAVPYERTGAAAPGRPPECRA